MRIPSWPSFPEPSPGQLPPPPALSTLDSVYRDGHGYLAGPMLALLGYNGTLGGAPGMLLGDAAGDAVIMQQVTVSPRERHRLELGVRKAPGGHMMSGQARAAAPLAGWPVAGLCQSQGRPPA